MDAPPPARPRPHRPAERVARPRRRLRAGISQLAGLLIGLALGLTLPRIHGGPQADAVRVAEVLGVVSLGVVSVTALIFSLLFLVVQWAAGNYTPRLALFRTDPLVWRVFALVIGLLTFTVTGLLAIGSRATVSIVLPAAVLLLTAVALILIRTLQLRAFRSIQLAQVLADTGAQGHTVISACYPAGRPAAPDPAGLPPVGSTVRWQGHTATVEQVNMERLVRAAAEADAVVEMDAVIGRTIQHGDRLADVRGGHLDDRAVTAALVVGRERAFHQDPLLALRLLADTGLRALSPAVHDPATAVEVLDVLDGLLRRLAVADLGRRAVADDRGTVRLLLAGPGWPEFVRTALDDLLRSAAGSPMVLLRSRELLTALRTVAPPDRRPPLETRLRWVDGQLADAHPPFVLEGTDP
ncbi:DUF2254 family protein [Kitasatospora sp. MBT63]|uniref:DUF2254 family protein n=1 Tax=Kitasatospora sp. MBT63 TaxID=1444768 RepID=UPI00068D14B9|nr:DUF2254 family protein [Kitasatospora sp. MBT63]